MVNQPVIQIWSLNLGDFRNHDSSHGNALTIELQMVSDEPPELGMKRDELYIAVGLAVAGCPRVAPSAGQSTSPVACSQATLLSGGGDGREGKQEDEPSRPPKAASTVLHGPQS